MKIALFLKQYPENLFVIKLKQKFLLYYYRYQLKAAKEAISSSTLLVMPTGLGKTAVQWMAMAEAIDGPGRIVLVAPTTGLVAQQAKMAKEFLKIDSERIAIYGGSAGGGLTIATSMMARDNNFPKVCFQMPLYPMIDDRNISFSNASKSLYPLSIISSSVTKITVAGASARDSSDFDTEDTLVPSFCAFKFGITK